MVIKEALRQTIAYDLWYKVKFSERNRRLLHEWREKGEPVPPPSVFKQMTVKEYARRFDLDTLIETGTFYGEMIYAVKDLFKKIYSIELSAELAAYNQKRFGKYRNIEIIQGDSAQIFPRLLSSVDKPCLMWLDAHYSGGGTARGQSDTPIKDELETVFQYAHDASCLLIDDARCFDGRNGYPELLALESQVRQFRPNWRFEISHDIIRIHR